MSSTLSFHFPSGKKPDTESLSPSQTYRQNNVPGEGRKSRQKDPESLDDLMAQRFQLTWTILLPWASMQREINESLVQTTVVLSLFVDVV